MCWNFFFFFLPGFGEHFEFVFVHVFGIGSGRFRLGIGIDLAGAQLARIVADLLAILALLRLIPLAFVQEKERKKRR